MESAREIFDQCCVEIAAHLAVLGFRYRPSQHSAVRACGDLTQQIHFQSNSRNHLATDSSGNGLRRALSEGSLFGELATFGSVALIEHANISSKALRSFRANCSKAWATDGAVAGGQIGNLQIPAKWVQFNLANPNTRPATIAKAIELIHKVAIPYLELFNTPDEVVDRLLHGSIPWIWEPSALEYACCFGNKRQAMKLLNRFVSELKNGDEYLAAIFQYREEGTPIAWDSRAGGRLAKAAIILGLE